MERNQLVDLHYITKIANVSSILQRGLLSHHLAARIPHQSVAMQVIQDRRARKGIPGGRPLHDYVNLYVNGRNPMLFKVLQATSVDELCLLRIAPDVLDLAGAVIADQNASSDYVRFANAPAGLALIDHNMVFATYWTHSGDEIAELRHKSAMCAEVLVPEAVSADQVNGAWVGSGPALHLLGAAAPQLAVALDVYKFFR